RTDVSLADQWSQQRRFRSLDADGSSVHRQLVAIARSEDSAANDSGSPLRPRRVVSIGETESSSAQPRESAPLTPRRANEAFAASRELLRVILYSVSHATALLPRRHRSRRSTCRCAALRFYRQQRELRHHCLSGGDAASSVLRSRRR